MDERADSGNDENENNGKLVNDVRNTDIDIADSYPIEKLIADGSLFFRCRKHFGKNAAGDEEAYRHSQSTDPACNSFILVFAAEESVDREPYERRNDYIWYEFFHY